MTTAGLVLTEPSEVSPTNWQTAEQAGPAKQWRHGPSAWRDLLLRLSRSQIRSFSANNSVQTQPQERYKDSKRTTYGTKCNSWAQTTDLDLPTAHPQTGWMLLSSF